MLGIRGGHEGQCVSREPISKSLRFEVFKRDGFACRYCGQTAPDVVLHVEHMRPVSRGGTNHPANLCTACSACNLGKAGEALGMLIEDQRCHALSFIILRKALEHLGSEVTDDPQSTFAILDFVASDDAPEDLIPLIQTAASWPDLKRIWLRHQGFPEALWSPSYEEAPE